MPVVTVNDLTAFAVLSFGEDNTLVQSLIQAATDHVDGYAGILGRCLINQTWRVDVGGWPGCREIRLPFPDVSAIDSVKYFDADNAEQTVTGTLYERIEDERGSIVRFLGDFSASAVYDDRTDTVRVTFTAGYGAAAADVPQAIRVAIMMLAAHWYNNREGQGEIPPAVMALLTPFRRISV